MRCLLILVMSVLSHLPLGVLRGLGALVGTVLYKTVTKRAHIARVNLKLCFPEWSDERTE